MSALCSAAKQGDVTAVIEFLDSGLHVDTQDEKQYTPLMYACDKGHLSLAKLLIDRGADVNAQEQFGEPGWTSKSNHQCRNHPPR